MRTVQPGRLGYEEISVYSVIAMSAFWPAGNRISYRDDGRSDNMLHLVLEGRRRYQNIRGECFEVGPGEVLLMPAGSRYITTVLSEEGVRGINIRFVLRDEQGEPCRLGEEVGVVYQDEDGRLREGFERTVRCTMRQGGGLKARELVNRLLDELFSSPGEAADPALQPAVAYMENHLQGPVLVEELARLCHMSVSTFSRRFRAVMQEPPAAYHRRLRLMKSRQLMESGLCTVEQAAFALGFYDKAHFSRCYKAQFGQAAGRKTR